MYETRLLITMDEHTRRRLRNTGLLLVLIGIGGIIVPSIMGLAISLLIAALLILAGILSGYVAWSSYNRAGSGWLKSIILVVLGLLIAFYPQAGTAAIGLMLILYFLMDGFANVVLSLELRPLPGWGWTDAQRHRLPGAGRRLHCRLALQCTLAGGPAGRHQPAPRRRGTGDAREGRQVIRATSLYRAPVPAMKCMDRLSNHP